MAQSRNVFINRAWVADHAELYRQLLQPPECCPVCFEPFASKEAYSPLMGDFPGSCTHFACEDCWDEIRHRDSRCPMCREDVCRWTQAQFGSLNYTPEHATPINR